MTSAPQSSQDGRGRAVASVGAATLGRDRALFANFFHRELFARHLGSITGLA